MNFFFRSLYSLFLMMALDLSAQDTDFSENDLFNEDSIVTEDEGVSISKSKKVDQVLNQKRVDFGGMVFNRSFVSIKRSVLLANSSQKSNEIDTLLQGDFFLDIRLTKGFKAYLSTTLQVYPSSSLNVSSFETANHDLAVVTDHFLWQFNEFWFDANIDYKSYFRIGKQVLQWGRGYFWNPMDLVNNDRLDFTDLDAMRSGVYGLRYFLPIKTIFNFYAFLKLDDIGTPQDYTLTLRSEFLAGPMELGVIAWFNWVRLPIIGFDASYGVKGWNMYLESVLSFEGMRETIKGVNLLTQTVTTSRSQGVHGKVLLGFNKSFQQGKWVIGSEAYFNSEGYERSALQDSHLRASLQAVTFLDLNRWYLAMYFTRAELWNKTTTLGLSGAVNLVDGSLLLLPSIQVDPVPHFFVLFQPILSIAFNHESEMSFRNRLMDFQLDIGARF